MATSFLDDADAVDPTTVEDGGQLYPAAQWLNGDPKLAAVGGIAHVGGIIIPSKYLDDAIAPPPGWTRTTVAFSSGKSEEVLATQKPRLAIIRTRFSWQVNYNGVTTFYPRDGYVKDSGMRGHMQVLCYMYGWDFPLTVTFNGKASQAMDNIFKEFDTKVVAAAAAMARAKKKPGRFPRFAFYMRLTADGHQKAGQKGGESIITPPKLDVPDKATEEYLSKIYVGRDNLLEFQAHFHESAEWGRAWDKAGAGQDHGESWDQEPDPGTGEVTGARWTAEDEHKAATALAQAKVRQSELGAEPEMSPSELEFEAELAAQEAAQGAPAEPQGPPARSAAEVRTAGSPGPSKGPTGFIRDINAWKKVLEAGEAMGYGHPNHVKGALVKDGWTVFNTPDVDKAIADLKKHIDAKRAAEAAKEKK